RPSFAPGTRHALRHDDNVHNLRFLRDSRVVGRQVYVADAGDAHSWILRHGQRSAMRSDRDDRWRIDGLRDPEAPGGGGSGSGVSRGSRIEDRRSHHPFYPLLSILYPLSSVTHPSLRISKRHPGRAFFHSALAPIRLARERMLAMPWPVLLILAPSNPTPSSRTSITR